MDFDKVVSMAQDFAEKKGLEFEIYLFDAKILKMEAENSNISNYTDAISNGFSLRLKKGDKISFSYCSGLDEEKVVNSFNNGFNLIGLTESNGDISFSSAKIDENNLYENNLGIYSDNFFSVDIETKKNNLIEMENIAYSFDKKIYKVDKPSYSEVLIAKRLVNSNSIDLSSKKTHYEIFLSAASKNNDENASGFDFDASFEFGSLKFKKVAMNGAKKAVDQLGARIIESGKYNVLFDNITSSELLSILKQSFYASSVYKKKSLLDGKIDSKVLSEKLTIIDDGTLFGGYGTDIFDGEGIAMQKKFLCLNGVIKTFLYDIEYANKFQVKSTGNSRRSSHKEPPELGTTNFFIETGKKPFIDVVSSIKNGLYITELMGLHMAKPYTGEFSLGASGFYVKNGQADFPIKGIVISGNIINLFNNIVEIADDIRFFGTIGSPSILIDDVQISGK
ncbi:MAG: TldD/PmbA family protein [Deltaproteobacteria bacterium]|nr:TldD/PmbA family protein [Deltaproteobacteria bacterium]